MSESTIQDIRITLRTGKGDIQATLFSSQVPLTVANFLNLARRGYYDGITFHRVIALFMIQGGDPTGTGVGGPGYKFEDECKPGLKHNKSGIFSMANSGPGTNGSQFFITHVPCPHLDGRHSVFGEVTKGQDVVDAIAKGDKITAIDIHDSTDALFRVMSGRIAAWNKKLSPLQSDSDGGEGTKGKKKRFPSKSLKVYDRITTRHGMRLTYIPPGTFMMGSQETEANRESRETQHRVTLTKGYYMGITTVTQDYWLAVMGKGRSPDDMLQETWEKMENKNPSYFKGRNLPVEKVSWYDAVQFCAKLSEMEGKKYRLPTEAEWEYACRAGTTTAYHTGDGDQALAEAGWYTGNAESMTHRGCDKKPNAWGLYDMHGNVWEWCSDGDHAYPDGAVTDPTFAATPHNYVVARGGSWICAPSSCRSAKRLMTKPNAYPSNNIGFRVVVSAGEEK